MVSAIENVLELFLKMKNGWEKIQTLEKNNIYCKNNY